MFSFLYWFHFNTATIVPDFQGVSTKFSTYTIHNTHSNNRAKKNRHPERRRKNNIKIMKQPYLKLKRSATISFLVFFFT